MAKKKLNKKVALTGLIILAFLILTAVIVLRSMIKDPDEILAKAATARRTADQLLQQYRTAVGTTGSDTAGMLEQGREAYVDIIRMYREAFGASKDDRQKIDILFTMSDFYLVNNEFHEPEWEKAIRAWYTVTNIDPRNVQARKNLLQYFYDAADSGAEQAWMQVREHVEGADADDPGALIKIITPDDKLYSFILRAKARANLSLAGSGRISDTKGAIETAIADFNTLLTVTPDDPDVYQYLADAILVKDRLQGSATSTGPGEKTLAEARTILQQAVSKLPDDPRPQINLLKFRLSNLAPDSQQFSDLKAEFQSLMQKFPSSPETFTAASNYYRAANDLDNAIQSISKAIELDPQNVRQLLSAVGLYYHNAFVGNDHDALTQAVALANRALDCPDAQDTPGPRRGRQVANRMGLLAFLARVYAENAIAASRTGDTQQQKTWADKAAPIVYQIEQIYGTTDNVNCIMWRGILALARGDKRIAVSTMYDAYQQMQNKDAVLSYMLATALEDSPEIGARIRFLDTAVRSGITGDKPDILLEYAKLLIRVRRFNDAASLAGAYESVLGPTDRTAAILASAYINSGQFDTAAEILDRPAIGADADTLKLSLLTARITRLLQVARQTPLTPEQQKQLDDYRKTRTGLFEKLLNSNPAAIDGATLISVCDGIIGQNELNRAKDLTDRFLQASPDNMAAKVYRRRLLEPDPLTVSADRYNEITRDVLASDPDELRRAVSLGRNYLQLLDIDNALAELKKARAISPDDRTALELLFQTALLPEKQDLDLASEIANKAVELNLDGVGGLLYLAQLDLTKQNYSDALLKINKALQAVPLSSRAYLLRSRANDAIKEYDQSIADARTAAEMNPVDISVLRQEITVLYNRDLRLGSSITPEQQAQTEDTLRQAINLNTTDWNLLSIYAQYRSKDHPEEALAIRQSLQERFPNVTNHVLLGRLALNMARTENDRTKQDALLQTAGSAFEKAYQLAPDDPDVLDRYSEYLRATAQQDKAIQLLAGRNERLWQFYLRDGQFEKAREILMGLYQKDPKQPDIVRGLVLVAGQTADSQAVQKYTQELIALETEPDAIKDNELLQIETFINVALVKEAAIKLAGFRERNPDDPRGVLLEAWIQMFQGKLDQALENANRYLELNSQNAAAWRLRGQIHRLLGNYPQAIDDLRKSKSISPSPLVSMDLARAYHQTNQISTAIGELRTALKDAMAPLRLRMLLEQYYIDAGRQSDLENFYQESIDKYPDIETWYYRAGRYFLGARQLPKAQRLLERAWEITSQTKTPSPAVFGAYLQTLYVIEKYQDVIRIATEYIDTPLAPIACAQLGRTHAKTGDTRQAIEDYQKAIDNCRGDDSMVATILLDMQRAVGNDQVDIWAAKRLTEAPDSVTTNLVMFNLTNATDQFDMALQHISKCISLVEKSSNSYSRYASIRATTLVRAYMKTNDDQYLTRAIDEYRTILNDTPGYLNAINNLAYLLADSGRDYKQAEEYGASAYAAAPNNANVIDTYAYTLCKTGKYARAKELLQMAIQLHELNQTQCPWEAYDHLGIAQEGLKENQNAVQSYKQAVQIGDRNITPKDRQRLDDSIQRLSQ
jgi:tetratricopeptide (TPR) repeat protein